PGKRRTVEVDVKRADLAVLHSEYLGHVALESSPLRGLQLISSQSAASVSIDDEPPHLHCVNHRVETLRGFQIGRLSVDRLDRARIAGENHIVRKERRPILLLLERAEVALDRGFGSHAASLSYMSSFITGRTSTAPSTSRMGQPFESSTACARSRASINVYPPTTSLASANGPPVTVFLLPLPSLPSRSSGCPRSLM